MISFQRKPKFGFGYSNRMTSGSNFIQWCLTTGISSDSLSKITLLFSRSINTAVIHMLKRGQKVHTVNKNTMPATQIIKDLLPRIIKHGPWVWVYFLPEMHSNKSEQKRPPLNEGYWIAWPSLLLDTLTGHQQTKQNTCCRNF